MKLLLIYIRGSKWSPHAYKTSCLTLTFCTADSVLIVFLSLAVYQFVFLFPESGSHHSRNRHRPARLPAWVLPSEDSLLRRQGSPRVLLRWHPGFWRLIRWTLYSLSIYSKGIKVSSWSCREQCSSWSASCQSFNEMLQKCMTEACFFFALFALVSSTHY